MCFRKKSKKHMGCLSLLIIIILIIIILFITLSIHQQITATLYNTDTSDNDDLYNEVPYIEANDYYTEHGQIINSYSAKTSNNVQTGKEVSKLLDNLGFDSLAIKADYDINGNYINERSILRDDDNRYPIYTTYYIADERVWYVFIIDGQIILNPIFYNIDNDYQKEYTVIIAESNIITSYDGVTNSFFQTIPKSSEIKVIVVDKIDAELLKTLLSEDINELLKKESYEK